MTNLHYEQFISELAEIRKRIQIFTRQIKEATVHVEAEETEE